MLRVRTAPNLGAKTTPFPHQLDAFRAIKDLHYAAIFHEQGLGKTKIALDLVLYWLVRDIVDSAIIVVKKGLIGTWRSEVSRHSHLTPRLLGQDRNANFYAFNSPARLYLVHYEALLSERKRLDLFLRTRRVGAILDEAHKIKNPDARVSQALHALSDRFVRRAIMTGTPVANRPYDLWSQIRFLDGGTTLGSDFSEVKRTLDLVNAPADNVARNAVFAGALEQLFEKIRHFSVRETKKTVGLKLPDKTIRNLECVLEARQAEIYRQYRNELAAIVVRQGRPLLDDAEGMLKRLVRLIQVASNPAMIDHSYQVHPGKFAPLMNLLYEAVDADEKTIVWTSFTENADWLGIHLEEVGAAVVHGGLGVADREDALDRFKRDLRCRVLIATPGAAKEGLTLTVANHAIFYDRGFSLDDYLQAQDRIHRISQVRPCYVTNLVAKDTVDSWVDALLAAKHLAAQLGQGDITRDEYETRADYSFGEMVRDVLRLDAVEDQ